MCTYYTMSFSERRAILLRILEIERNIKDIEHSNDYLKTRRGLKLLENARNGGGTITISSPSNLDTTIEIRKNSSEVANCIAAYREMMREDVLRIDTLNVEKLQLKRELLGGQPY
jgi:hypothetical protein